MRFGALPDETGTWNPIWLQEESGVVGADGMIRTSSPPWPGIIRPGEYIVAYSGESESVTLVKGQLTVNYNLPIAFYGVMDSLGKIGQLLTPDQFGSANVALTVSYDISSVKVMAVPTVGLPVITEVGVQRNQDGIASFSAALNMPAPAESEPTAPPVLLEAELKFSDENNQPFENNQPVLFLTGSNVLVNSGSDLLGSRFEDLVAKFYVGDKAYEGTVLPNLSRELGDNRFEVAVKVPNTVPLGASRIVLTRRQNHLVGQNGTEPVYEEVEYDSNNIRINQGAEYIFAAQRGADRLAVLDGTDPESVVEASNSSKLLLASIPVGTPDRTDWPRASAVTSDGTRVYVVLETRGSLTGRVALVDPLVLQQVDTQPDIPDINPIDLPVGAKPWSIAINSRNEYAYISDSARGNIYILDINPFSETYHQVVQTIAVNPASSGLRKMAISSDGRKLFVTAANGYIYVINIDGQDRPTAPNQNERKWHEQIGAVLTNNGADGVAATADPLKLTFTNGQQNSDAKGFGVLEVTNDDPLNFAASARYIDLSLGNVGDYFDVNEGVAVTVMPDGRYAFVAGRNRQGSVLQTDKRAGGNIGIIKDPLTNPQLVAATRPIPLALTTDLVLSNDSKYLYASYPNTNGTGSTYVFDVEEIIETLENPGNFLIDGLDRGEGSPFFDAGSAKNATWGDLSKVPVDDINPEISVAADYGIVQGNWASYQFTYGVLPNSTRGPVALAGGSWGLSAAPADWLSLNGPIGLSENSSNPLTPTFKWDFEYLLPEDVEEVNLFVSVFDEGNGLLPWDELVDLSGPDGNEFLSKQGLDRQEQLNLLTELWNISFYGKEDDFNPNRILTATWQRDEDGIGKWTWDGGKTWTEGTNTSFTLPNNRTLTAGQTYYWAVEAWNKEGKQNIDFGEFNTPLPPALNGEDTFRSVTVLTHGFKPPFFSQPGIPQEFYEMADNIANAGGNNDGLILRYHRPTGYWVTVNKYGQVPGDLPSGLNPETDPEYLKNLRAYITPYFRENKPLVLLNDWSQDRESAVPDSGFTEAAADAFFASLVQLDGLLKSEGSVANQGALFNSPLHFIGFSRGTVVNSEIIQRLGTYFPEAGGKENSGIRDLQMTTLDPHDFDQPGLNVITQNFGDFREPKVQVWGNVTFADNYYQTVPNLMGGTVTPAGRDIPNLPPTEAGKTAPGLQLPRQGWRSENPNPTAPLLGEPDLSVFLGTNQDNSLEYINSRAGFTRETDPGMGIGGKGATHGRVQTWYAGTTDLFPTVFPFPEEADSQNIYRRRGDGYYEELFDKEFSFGDTVSQPPRVSPWYTPEPSRLSTRC